MCLVWIARVTVRDGFLDVRNLGSARKKIKITLIFLSGADYY